MALNHVGASWLPLRKKFGQESIWDRSQRRPAFIRVGGKIFAGPYMENLTRLNDTQSSTAYTTQCHAGLRRLESSLKFRGKAALRKTIDPGQTIPTGVRCHGTAFRHHCCTTQRLSPQQRQHRFNSQRLKRAIHFGINAIHTCGRKAFLSHCSMDGSLLEFIARNGSPKTYTHLLSQGYHTALRAPYNGHAVFPRACSTSVDFKLDWPPLSFCPTPCDVNLYIGVMSIWVRVVLGNLRRCPLALVSREVG